MENKTFLKKSFSLQTKTISLVAICSQCKESLRKKKVNIRFTLANFTMIDISFLAKDLNVNIQ